MLDNLIHYFDLSRKASPPTPAPAGPGAGGPGGPGVPWWLQYLALIAGIIIQPSFAAYQRDHAWSWPYGIGWILFSVIVGVIVFPAVYRKTFDANPRLVSIAPIFTAGLGWQSLMATAIAVAGGSA